MFVRPKLFREGALRQGAMSSRLECNASIPKAATACRAALWRTLLPKEMLGISSSVVRCKGAIKHAALADRGVADPPCDSPAVRQWTARLVQELALLDINQVS